MLRRSVSLLIVCCFATRVHAATVRCPESSEIPQLSIYDLGTSAIPVYDKWQVFWGNVPLSDVQVAAMGGADGLIEQAERQVNSGGFWIYTGFGIAALGTAVSSAGWVLYGDSERRSQALPLTMAIGGIIIGVAGVLLVTESVQNRLEPYIAPTPRHRMSREEMRRLVIVINQNMYRQFCRAVEEANREPPSEHALRLGQ